MAKQTTTAVNKSTNQITGKVTKAVSKYVDKTTDAGRYLSGTSRPVNDANDIALLTDRLYNIVGSLYGINPKNSNNILNNDQNNTDTYRNDFIMDAGRIRDALNQGTNASYDSQRQEAAQNLANYEGAQARNQISTIANLRNSLMTSALNGANTGAVNANILSTMLQGNQANAQTGTQALQNLQNIAAQRQAALAGNAAAAIDKANAAAAQYATANAAANSNTAQIRSALLGAAGQAAGYGLQNVLGEYAGQTTQNSYGNTANNNLNTATNTKQTSKSTTKRK